VNSIATTLSLDNSGTMLTSTAFSGETYYPGGAVETAKLAIDPTSNVAGVALSRTYDNRGRITGEVDTDSLSQSAYHYSLSYDANSNVTTYNDSVTGSWTATYDALHRWVKSTGTMNGVAATFQQTYDHFGNRNVEYFTYNGTETQPSPYLNFTTGSNRVVGSTYDNAGNLYSDGTNDYLYDAENRLCAVKQLSGGDSIGYVYAANGPRLGRGNLTTFSCDVTKNGLLTANGLALTNAYMVGPQGERLEETDGNFNMLHYNVFWEGKLLGTFTGTTYVQSNWHFALNGHRCPVALLVTTYLKQAPAPTRLRSSSPEKSAIRNPASTTFWLGITAPIGADSSARMMGEVKSRRTRKAGISTPTFRTIL
jgi:YD repeat-containing protein